MAKPQGGLGRGLGALISSTPKPAPAPATTESAIEPFSDGSVFKEVDPEQIVPNPHQPRSFFSPAELDDLVASIREHGLLQPLIVTEKGDGVYELIAGERRLRASKMLGLKTIPVVVRTASEQQKLELALIENIQRHDLNPVEEARAYKQLMDLFSHTQQQVSDKVGKSRPQVANTIRLLELDEDMLHSVEDGSILRSQARTLLGEDDKTLRRELYEKMLAGAMTVAEAEARVQIGSTRRKPVKGKDPNIAALEDELRTALGTKVQIDMKGASGKVSIHFYSREELKELIQKLTK